MGDLPKTKKEKWRRTMFAAMDICAKGQEAPTPALIGDFYAFAEALEAEKARLKEALEKAEKMFRFYGDLHAAKPDHDKAKRNYDMADRCRAALKESEDAKE